MSVYSKNYRERRRGHGGLRSPGRRRLQIGLGLSCALLVAACGSSGSTSAGSSGTETAGTSGGSTSAGVTQARAAASDFLATPAKILQTVPLPSAPPKGKTLVMVGTSEPTNVQDQKGIAAAAAAIGWHFSVVDYDPANPSTLDGALTTALTKHPVAVIEAGLPQSQISMSVLSAYASAGVPLELTAAYPFQASKWILGNTDGYPYVTELGVALGDWFIADSGGTGKAIMEHVPGYPVLNGFVAGFNGQVHKLCPACQVKVVNVTLPQVAAGQIVSTVTSAVRANPSYKYIIFDVGDFAVGITSALQAAGISGKIIAGNSVDAEGAAALHAGTEAAWTGVSPYYQAYAVVDVILRWLEHADGTAQDQMMPTQILTSSNIGSTTVWNRPANALAQFEALWKVPVTPCPLDCSG